MKKLVVLFSVLSMTAACGDDATKSASNNGGANNGGGGGTVLVKPGTTEACGLVGREGKNICGLSMIECQAGQYCQNEFCEVGCTSDNNCAANQFCAPGTDNTGVGTCVNCETYTPPVSSNNTPSNNTPSNNTPSNNTPTGITAACDTIINAAVTCELVPANQAAAAKTGCSQESEADVNLLLTCVNAANGDCEQTEGCVGGGDTGCDTDDECNTTTGQLHEVCSGGSCTFGCRIDADCGQDYVCDLDAGFGDAGMCTPDF